LFRSVLGTGIFGNFGTGRGFYSFWTGNPGGTGTIQTMGKGTRGRGDEGKGGEVKEKRKEAAGAPT